MVYDSQYTKDQCTAPRPPDILEDKGKVPRHVRFELNDNIREAGLSGEWWRMGDDELGDVLKPLVEKFVMDA